MDAVTENVFASRVHVAVPAMLSVPLGSGWSGWIEPGTSAVNVAFQLRSELAV